MTTKHNECVISGSDHVTTAVDHVITATNHVTTDGDHVITATNHVTTDGDHVTTGDVTNTVNPNAVHIILSVDEEHLQGSVINDSV